MESKTNITNIPLNAGAIFIGTYEDVSPYVSAIVSILADTQATITCYQSLNKQRTSTTTLQYTNATNLQTFVISPITLPFIYFIVQNSSATNQSYLNFSVKYVSTTVSSNTSSSNVNITNTQLPVSQYGNWNVAINSIAKGNSTLWDSVNTGINGTSSSLNLSNSTQTNITFFGTVSGATNLIVQFSLDGTNFYSSQYSYNVSTSGQIGFNIQASPYYCRLLSTNDITAKIIATYN